MFSSNNFADAAEPRRIHSPRTPRDLSDKWAAGDVTITSADGSVVTEPAYSKDQVLAIIRGSG